MLEASNLECVRGEKSLFRDMSFQLEANAYLMVQDANDSSKTSLLRMLCGLAQPAQGEIRWDGEPIRKLAEDYRGELLYCGHVGALKDDLTALDKAAVATLCGVIDAHLAAGGMAVLTSHQDLPLATTRIEQLRLD